MAQRAARKRRPLALGCRRDGGLVCALLLAAALSAGCASKPVRFDIWDATELADAHAPRDGRVYVKFFLPAGATLSEGIEAFRPLLTQAAERDHHLALLGADSGLNRQVLIGTLEEAAAGLSLDDVRLVYLGPERDRAELVAAAEAAGLELEYVVYP